MSRGNLATQTQLSLVVTVTQTLKKSKILIFSIDVSPVSPLCFSPKCLGVPQAMSQAAQAWWAPVWLLLLPLFLLGQCQDCSCWYLAQELLTGYPEKKKFLKRLSLIKNLHHNEILLEEFIESLEKNEIRQNGFHFKPNPNSFPEYYASSVIKFQKFWKC